MAERLVDVLVVEDDLALRDAISATLRDARFRVAVAGDVFEAVRLLNGPARARMVLTDLFLPEKSGIDLIEYLRRTPSMSRIACAVMTGRPASLLAYAARHVGLEVLRKPFGDEALFGLVERTLAPRRG